MSGEHKYLSLDYCYSRIKLIILPIHLHIFERIFHLPYPKSVSTHIFLALYPLQYMEFNVKQATGNSVECKLSKHRKPYKCRLRAL